MIFVYNFLQVILLVAAFPLLLLIVLCREKYRGRIVSRLGLGLPAIPVDSRPSGARIWIHCLSVGEVTSAIPLIRELRQRLSDTQIYLTVSTATGKRLADMKIGHQVDKVLSGPLDLLPTINRFINVLRPDLFILVETDFWPNWLAALKRRNVPIVLVNGRISRSSHRKYNRYRFIFGPMFSQFSLLCMQTREDARQLQTLGVPESRLIVLGNLKYDTGFEPGSDQAAGRNTFNLDLPQQAQVWVCGSTHPGEEEILLSVFADLRSAHPDLRLIIAPRDPARSRAIAEMAGQKDLPAVLRSAGNPGLSAVIILDTIGELAWCYRLARFAFIGGSLVDCGGHNPLEAAAHKVPCLFGPHMEDFHEIARDLVECEGAAVVSSEAEIRKIAATLLDNPEIHARMSRAAGELISHNKGVTGRHVKHIVSFLPSHSTWEK